MLEDGSYLIPANSKKANLIFNLFRPIDLGILLTGLTITVIIAMMIPLDNTIFLIIALLPLFISVLLVAPVPNYNNVLILLTSIIQFYSNRRFYVWKGWNFYESIQKEK